MRILDFGIAKLLTRSVGTSQEVRGTPLYIACEQITGQQVSPQTDIWAFGLIAFRLLFAKSYWRSAQDKGARPEALFAEIVTLPLDPPGQRLLELGVPVELPKGFDDWFLRCVARRAEDRFESAEAAARGLREVLTDGPLRFLARGKMPRPEERSGRSELEVTESVDPGPIATTSHPRKTNKARRTAPALWLGGISLAGATIGLVYGAGGVRSPGESGVIVGMPSPPKMSAEPLAQAAFVPPPAEEPVHAPAREDEPPAPSPTDKAPGPVPSEAPGAPNGQSDQELRSVPARRRTVSEATTVAEPSPQMKKATPEEPRNSGAASSPSKPSPEKSPAPSKKPLPDPFAVY